MEEQGGNSDVGSHDRSSLLPLPENASELKHQFDLVPVIGECLDRHLVFPLLEFLQHHEVYPEREVMEAKIKLLSKTNMLDFEVKIWQALHSSEEIPSEMKVRRKAVVVHMQHLTSEVGDAFRDLIDGHPEEVRNLREDKNFTPSFLEKHYEIQPQNIDALFKFAKFKFECGDYNTAAYYLELYRELMNGVASPEQLHSALWGKFAAEILMREWDLALDDLNVLNETVDGKGFGSTLEQLQQRVWLIHWSLFVFFNHPNGRNGIVDLLFRDWYMNAIQTACPHILRYLIAAVITNKRRRNVLPDLVKVIQQEAYNYRDPITEFVEKLYIEYDFDGALQKLRECQVVLKNDFFLTAVLEEFVESARVLIFETYCRIHQQIEIGMLAEKLNMSTEAAEKWIVNLIRNARLDAKIDSKESAVIMTTQSPSVYQQIIEKTRGLSMRSQIVSNNLNAAIQAKIAKEEEERDPTTIRSMT